MKNLFIVCILYSFTALADFTWYLPVKGQTTNKRKIKVVVKVKRDRCKDMKVLVSHKTYELKPTQYPGERVAEVKLVDGPNFAKLISKKRHCNSEVRIMHKKNISSIQLADELVKSMGVLEPKSSERRSPFWEDSMLFLGLVQYMDDSNLKKEIKTYLDYYFSHIQEKGMKKMNHPDRVPMVMANVLYNQKFNTDRTLPVRRFEGFLDSSRENKLGLVDHMGEAWFKRIGSQVIGKFLGDPHSVWADSMMMYIMPSILVGYYDAANASRDSYRFGITQLEKMNTILQQHNGLFKHSWDYKKGKFRPRKRNAFWLRANGWAVATLAYSLDHIQPRSWYYKRVQHKLKRALTKLVKLKDPNTHLWRTILLSNGEYNKLRCKFDNDYETSGSALVAWSLALAIKHKVLDDTYTKELLNIYNGLTQFISARNGKSEFKLNWMSGLTNAHRGACGYELFYNSNDKNHSYGIGPFLMLTHTIKELDLL